VLCSNCGTDNRRGRKFCAECGQRLAGDCPNCGAANEPDAKFCGECGEALSPAPATSSAPYVERAERRLVSVLFADLVGFTTLSESRDPEDVRDLLTRYFELTRRVIGRYGGTLEKFIGDAVMAVWGTPVAQEDDAERSVRSAVDLTAAVEALGNDSEIPELRLRAGVVTGQAAVTVGAEGQGMVAGDLVNTASRVQALAQPGTVLVNDKTRLASEAAIAYEPAGSHEVRGRRDRVELWRAVRVVAARRGALRAAQFESPFVGRSREMHLTKELFHSSAEDKRAHIVSVSGVAGIGKSRLSWEFEKYIDGLAADVFWHRGRCLAYGEGVSYWALGEMVRMRAQILENEDTASALDKLRATLEDFIPDEEERRWVEPRLAHLLGLGDDASETREDLFAAWRLFFERLADRGPTVMVFEDLQWADTSLLDFIEYLLDWSRSHPLFIITLARPELMERREAWGAGRRNFTSIYLEPLDDAAMDQLIRGLVPGLPDELRLRLADQAEGVPLYAVETVRMLLSMGLLEKRDERFYPTRPIQDIEVPTSLQALIAARLDGLSKGERRLIQVASILGKSFSMPALCAVYGRPEAEVSPVLDSLTKKELLTVQADPRSPERGQYGFVQALVRKVAHDTLSRKDRKAGHLAVAGQLETTWEAEGHEIAEVIASHLVDAYEAAPEDSDAEDLKARARTALRNAGQRARSLGAQEEAQRYFERAAELTDDSIERAGLLERAGEMAGSRGRADQAATHFETAINAFRVHGETHAAARVSARLADIIWDKGQIEEAVELMERSFDVLKDEEPDRDLAMLAAQLGRFHSFTEDLALAAERLDFALSIAESLRLPQVLSEALNSKSIVLELQGRKEEAMALLKHSLDIALEHDLSGAANRALYNLTGRLIIMDRYSDAMDSNRRGLELARRVGSQASEWYFLSDLYSHYVTGRWDEVIARAGGLPPVEQSDTLRVVWTRLICAPLLQIHTHRGAVGEAREMFCHWGNSVSHTTSKSASGTCLPQQPLPAPRNGTPRPSRPRVSVWPSGV
jgi:class 3 adenylate cyclase/tetratricopeptide (TPR) repeat protein